MVNYNISNSRFLPVSISLVIISFIISWIYYVLKFYLGFEYAMGIYPVIDLFDLDEENTILVWLGSGLLAIAGLLSFFISKQDIDANKKHWLGICALLVFLSVDEASMVHERSEILSFSIVFLIFLFSGSVSHFNFIFRISKSVNYHLVLSAIFFVSGSIFIDLLNSQYIQEHGRDNIVYRGLATVEEGLEFTGIFLILQGLIQELDRITKSV